MKGQNFTVNSLHTLKAAQDYLARQFEEKKWLSFELNYDQQRTSKQNSALHVYCSLLSNSFNEGGFDMIKVLSHHAEIPWDERGYNVKEKIWKPIQKTLIQKGSTTEANRVDYSNVYEVVNNYTATKMGISIAWPTKEKLI